MPVSEAFFRVEECVELILQWYQGDCHVCKLSTSKIDCRGFTSLVREICRFPMSVFPTATIYILEIA